MGLTKVFVYLQLLDLLTTLIGLRLERWKPVRSCAC